ncbi:MAG: hypothetical protein KDA24_07680, partial [Deltaproteobacteria bacterium]|nr:hypothetical protein [Deltaproteobacteria bacterium]
MAAALPLALSPALALAEEVDASAEEGAEEGDDTVEVGETPVADEPAKELNLRLAPAEPDDLSYLGVKLWESVQGSRVQLRLDDALEVRGVLLTQAEGEIAIAREPEGVVMRIPKNLVLGVRLLPSLGEGPGLMPAEDPTANKPPPGGQTMAAVGGILTGIGVGMMTTFAIGTAVDSSFAYYAFPLMFIGPSMLGPGIPLLTGGLAREEKRTNWIREREKRELDLSMGPTLHGGWSGRLTLRW